MTRYYCDCCNAQITKANECAGGKLHCPDSRLGIEVEKNGVVLKVEIMTSLDGVANAGHFCRFCVLDALKMLDTRNQPAKPKPVKMK